MKNGVTTIRLSQRGQVKMRTDKHPLSLVKWSCWSLSYPFWWEIRRKPDCYGFRVVSKWRRSWEIFVQFIGCKVKKRDLMILKVKLGGRESYFKMGDIWGFMCRKEGSRGGGTGDQREKDREGKGTEFWSWWKGCQALVKRKKEDKQRHRDILKWGKSWYRGR